MSANVKRPKSLWWFEPGWSYRPRLKAEFSRLLQLRMWLRVLAAVFVLVALLALVAKRAMPDLEFDWATALVQSVGVFVLAMVLLVGMFLVIPPVIHVTARGISRQHGQNVHWHLRAQLHRLTVDLADPARPRLCVETSGMSFEAGISSKITPVEILAFAKTAFPELPVEERR